MLAMMWNVIATGTGNGASLAPREAAGKTGTTQNSQDAWFVGFTTDYVTGVWVGNDDNSATRGVTGGTLPAMIWKSAMRAAEKGLPLKPLDRSPPQPPNERNSVPRRQQRAAGCGDDEAGAADGADPAPAACRTCRRRRSRAAAAAACWAGCSAMTMIPPAAAAAARRPRRPLIFADRFAA